MTLTLVLTVIILLFFCGKMLSEIKNRERKTISWQKAKDKADAERDRQLAENKKKIEQQEDRIAKLEYRMNKAESDIAYYSDLVDTLYNKRDKWEEVAKKAGLDIEWCEAKRKFSSASAFKESELEGYRKNMEKAEKEIEKLNRQIKGAEDKLEKAEFERKEAERKLCA